MKINLLLVKAGIEFARDVLTSPCTAKAFSDFVRKALAAGLISSSRYLSSKQRQNEYGQYVLNFAELENEVSVDEDLVAMLIFEDDNGDELVVKTSAVHLIACAQGFVPNSADEQMVLSNADDAEDWLRSRFLYLDSELS